MKRWTALCVNKDEKRWSLLSRTMQDLGVANEYVPWTHSIDQFQDLNLLNEFDHVRFCADVGMRIVPHLKVQSSWITLLGVVDGMIRRAGSWWPLCALHDSLGEILIELGHDIDKHGNVLLAGASGEARGAIAAFFKAGFRKFLVTHSDEPQALRMIKEVNRHFFGLDIQWTPIDRIIILPGETTVLINCKGGPDDDPLLAELSYLNFLKRPGFIFDLSGNKPGSLLLREGKDASATVLSMWDVGAYQDALWAKWAFECDLDRKRYHADLLALLAPSS